MLLSELLHGNYYFAGHLRPSSAWLNVMDGEEMVMSETLQVLPDPSNSIITVTFCLSPTRESPAHLSGCSKICDPHNRFITFGKLSDIMMEICV